VVPNATVELQREGSFELQSTTASPSGDFFFLNEPSGFFELVAEDSFGLVGRARAEREPSVLTLEQDVLLPAFGTVRGTVFDSAGSPPLDVESTLVELTNANLRAPRTVLPDVSGVFQFERVATGSFTVTYDDHSTAGTVVPGSTTGRLSEAGNFPEITLPDLGDVSGRLRAGDGTETTPSGELAPVIVEGRQQESRAGISTKSGEVGLTDGSFRVEDVPAGEVTVTIIDEADAGASTGTVEAGIEATDLDVTLGTATALPVEMGLPTGNRHEVQADGSVRGEDLVSGSEVVLSMMSVNAKPYPALASAVSESPDQQLVFGPVRTAGVLHTRKVFVPPDASFARFLEILENPNGFAVDITLDVTGDIFASNLTTSSGDAALDATDGYLAGVLDTGAGVAIVFTDNLGALVPDAARTDGDAYQHVWRGVTIPAGGRVILMHFAVQAADRDGAIAKADELLNQTDPTALSGLTTEERSQVVNFSIP
jgi:hypothetical protein